jgi:chromosome segregation ATPase
VIAQIMIFALGFLVASLSALMVLPLFWRRARRLARRRVEMSMPLSVNEVLADRDRLRAEFAVERCRLAESLDAIVVKRARAMADLARTEAALFEMRERASSAEVEADARAAEGRELAAQLGAAIKSVYDAQHASAALHSKSVELENDYNRLRIEASAGAVALDALEAQRSELASELGQRTRELAEARGRGAAAEARIEILTADMESTSERLKQAELFSKATLARANAEEQRAELLDRTLARVRHELEEARHESDLLRRELAKAEARTDALRASLERQAEVRKSLDSDVSARLVSAETQISGLKGALDEARRETAELRRAAGSRRRSGTREPRPLKGLEVVSEERTEASARTGEPLLDRPA